jgi:NADPH-dependent ferric siderophore reductase
VQVQQIAMVSPCLARVTLGGAELEGFTIAEPAASVRLLLSSSPSRELVMPTWNGNEFLMPDGRRPVIRTFTPRASRPRELELDIVIHDGGVASEWVTLAAPGAAVAVSGPGRGYTINREVDGYVLAGDESAIPAMSQLLEALPPEIAVRVIVEARPDARLALPEHPRSTVEWCASLFECISAIDVGEGERVWAAGEAAAMQRIRRYLFEERSIPRAHTTIRGYWKHGRAGDADGD